ncbi:MAG: hypothetical protein NC043_06785 [Muribaculaceae bacterium]|nr:hypothetical protein [Muribaculaceae bacterium]
MNKGLLTRICVSVVLMLCAYAASAADLSRFLVRCYLYDGNWNRMDSVRVTQLMKNDTIPVPFKVLGGYNETDLTKDGQMRLAVNSGMGEYTLLLEKDGYEPVIKHFKVASMNDETKDLDAARFEPERFKRLDEVTVRTTRVKMVMKGDTMVFNADAFNLQEGSMLDALVRQLPGATLDEDGVITVNGRKISELLINGKDFFKGDPQVALQNLPSYTVKDIKVYDKEDDDNYLTHARDNWTTREEEQNLVMDVNLKKEYDTGWMANVETGGGTASLYKLRGFGMGYTDKFRLAVFGNFNNLGDTQNASSRGDWTRSWRDTSGGITTVQKGGADYTYTDKKKGISMTGNAIVSHNKVDIRNIQGSTRFFPSGNLYDRSKASSLTKQNTLITEHDWEYRGGNLYVNVMPRLRWTVTNLWADTRSATFAANPAERFRGEAIDSLFSRGASSSYAKELLTRLLNMRVMHESDLEGSVSVSTTYSPKKIKGSFNFMGGASMRNDRSRSRTDYLQTLGPLAQEGSTPISSDRYRPDSSKGKRFYLRGGYTYRYNRFDEKRNHTINVAARVAEMHQADNHDTEMFLAALAQDADRLPSLTMPDNAIRDYENTYYSSTIKNTFTGGLDFQYRSQPLAPGDSTFNATWITRLNFEYGYGHESLDYDKPTVIKERVNQDIHAVMPGLYLALGSENKIRNINTYIQLQEEMTPPDIIRLLSTVDNSDPLNIYMGRPSGLKNSHTFSTVFGFQRYARAAHKAYFTANVRWNVIRNAVAMARTYNPLTGVSVFRPDNINGNWNVRISSDYSIRVGSRRQTELHAGLEGAYVNSVDYMAIDAIPQRSSVRNLQVKPNVGLRYAFNGGGTVAARLAVQLDNATSPRADFSAIHARTYEGNVRAAVKLPWQLELNSSLNLRMRRGYADASMNTNEWLWNADISRGFFKGKPLVLKLTAFDILDSAKEITVNVNAQGRVERWQNMQPRYVMLSAIYRLDMKPRSQNK